MTQGPFPDEQDADGNFERQEDEFRDLVGQDPRYPAEPGRYHLYISLACPWAHRTLITRHLLGLENVISASVVDPVRDERGWRFTSGDGHSQDQVEGFHFLSEAYELTKPHFHGRVTVPVLWDKQSRRIVNNSEDDICRMFQEAFSPATGVDLFPSDIAEEQAELSQWIYERINNGVYRAGFASRQAAYDKGVQIVFAALEEMEERLAHGRYLFGHRIVESDWRLFCTLVRFDPAYHGHFKCNLKMLKEYPNLSGYLRDLYQQPGIADTVSIRHIKKHYYLTHPELDPSGIVPMGPEQDLGEAHGRDKVYT
ncbi:MAG: Glutathione transferase [Akkermansiaceae bacterium]|nr:Glutathione transferase [Akkermansiaceae bacterium]